ncbi:TetR/AcrR family transcriptional regulator [Thomasclavelia sp.]
MNTKEKIIKVATQEFLKNGYQATSLRRIAKEAQVTTGAMYGYYRNKESLFNSIVDEVGVKFRDDYLNKTIDQTVIDYIYQNLVAFKLIICNSKGTRYEEYLDSLVNEKTKQLKEEGFDDKLVHIINHSYLFGVFEIVRHQMSKKQAEIFVNDLQEFYQAGWDKLLKRKEK